MDFFVARQPILDRREKLYGYELLFRNGDENSFSAADPDKATTNVIVDTLLNMGIDSLTGGKRAFINFTANLLKGGVADVIPPDLVVIEILEDVVPDEDVLKACRKLRDQGYILALDDFVFNESYLPLIDLAHIIKIDVKATPSLERLKLMYRLKDTQVKFLAEKVETREDYEEAFKMGFSLFQGYFFGKPMILQGKDIPTDKVNYLRLMREINNPDADYVQLEETIKRDVSLALKLLKYINSPAFAFKSEIKSIRQALALLGLAEMRKWGTLVALGRLGDEKPNILLINAVVRGIFAEGIGKKIRKGTDTTDFFFSGLFSLIDAILDRPLVSILNELPLNEGVKRALLGENNPFKQVLDCVIAYEKGNWNEVCKLAQVLNINERSLVDLYYRSLTKSNAV